MSRTSHHSDTTRAGHGCKGWLLKFRNGCGAFYPFPHIDMENTEPGALTLNDIKHLYADEEVEKLVTTDDYADELRYGIACYRAELRRIRAKRATLGGRWIRLIRWASQPKRHHPQLIPGVGLELTILCVSVLLGIGHLVLVFQA